MLVGRGNVWVAAGAAAAPALEAEVGSARLLVEPEKRNTLGGICWALAHSLAEDPETDTLIVVLPSDHAIGDETAFASTLNRACEAAESEGGLGTIGIRPARAETGYGYLEMGLPQSDRRVSRVTRFREKPSESDAERFIASGSFLWNSGMFVWKRSEFLVELRKALPDSHAALLQMADDLRVGNDAAAISIFASLPVLSVDVGVMERAEFVWVVPAEFAWDDLGSWDALARVFPRDESGNVAKGNVVCLDSSNCVVYSDLGSAPVAILGLSDLVVVATENGILVCPKTQSQNVREVVARLRKK
jgi:mannose-1-phosphate guanylyltransferase